MTSDQRCRHKDLPATWHERVAVAVLDASGIAGLPSSVQRLAKPSDQRFDPSSPLERVLILPREPSTLRAQTIARGGHRSENPSRREEVDI